jgi:dCTP deaminase
MILTGQEIIKRVKSKEIFIDPFEEENVNPNSYNYRLGTHYKTILNKDDKNIKAQSSLDEIPMSGLLVKPGMIILSTTFETIGSDKFVTSLIGRSSVGRLGLFLQISADLGQLGPSHKWTLEITCVQPIIIYPKMKIGQISFWVPVGRYDYYSGAYTEFDDATECLDGGLYGMK